MRTLRKYFDRYPRRCEALLIPLAWSGIFWIFLGRYLGGQYSTATWLDNTHFLLPLFTYISRSFAGGEFPYWINSIAGGVPLYNTPQFSVLYPFYFFHWNLYRTPLDASLYVHYITLLHVGILWMSTYVMLRIFHLRIISSVLGATLFAFCANTYFYLFWVNIISPYSWFPLAVGSVFLILENKSPKAGLVLGWISIYLLTSASPAQPLIHFVCCAAFLAVSYGVVHQTRGSKLIVPLRNLVLLVLGSVLLVSATLIPTLLFSRRDMVRFTEAGAVTGNERIPFKGFLTGQSEGRELAKVLFPLNTDQVLGDSWLGIVPIFLALFGLFRSKKDWVVIPLFLLAAYALISSAGANLGVAYINYWIPLLNKIREPARHLYVFALATCTLAAFGFEHVTSTKWFERADFQKHVAVFGAFLLLLLGSYWVRKDYTTRVSDSILLWSFGLFLIVLIIGRVTGRSNSVAHVILAGIAVYPAFRYPAPIVKIEQGDYFMEANLRSHRILQQLVKIDDIRRYRLVVADDQFNTQWWSMNAIYYDLRTFEAAMNPLPASRLQEIFVAPSIPRYSQLLGAKYYLDCRGSLPRSNSSQSDIQWPGAGAGSITLVNPKTGGRQALDAGLHDSIADLTYRQGWIPLNQKGNAYQVIDFGGGQMFVDADHGNQAAPLNVILGGAWSPSQLDALPDFLAQHTEVSGGLSLPIRHADSASPFTAPAGYSLQREIEGCKFYVNNDALPYYFLSRDIGGTYGNAQQFFEIIGRGDAGFTKVLVEPKDARRIADWLGPAGQALNVEAFREERSTNRFRLGLRTNHKSLLVLNEYFAPEWQVTVNGKASQPIKVNLNQIAVLLPEGTNQVQFEYRPRLFVRLLYMQWASFSILAAGITVLGITHAVKALGAVLSKTGSRLHS